VSWNHHLKTYLHGLHHFLRLTFPNRVIILMKTGRPRQPKPSVRSARVPNRSPSHSGRITEPKPKPSVRSVRAPRASLLCACHANVYYFFVIQHPSHVLYRAFRLDIFWHFFPF
jgi:hypothetical protein